MNCFSSNLVCMLQCNKCNVQYIGETKRHLSDRFDEHGRGIEEAIGGPKKIHARENDENIHARKMLKELLPQTLLSYC